MRLNPKRTALLIMTVFMMTSFGMNVNAQTVSYTHLWTHLLKIKSVSSVFTEVQDTVTAISDAMCLTGFIHRLSEQRMHL